MTFNNSAWQKYKTITVSNTNVSADCVDFPLKVALNGDADIGAICLASGYDVVFTDTLGTTALSFQRDSFSVSAGAATGIFKVKCTPTTASSLVIRVYFGNAAATDTSSTSAWNSNFKSVLRCDETGTVTTWADATSNGNSAANQGATAGTGLLNGGMITNGTTSQYAKATMSDLGTQFAYEVVIKPTNFTNDYACVVAKNESSASRYCALLIRSSGKTRLLRSLFRR